MTSALGCPICGARGAREMYRFVPARSIPGSVVRCLGCTTMYKVLADPSKPPSAYYDDSYADSDYWTPDDASTRAFTWIRDAIARVVSPRGASLLDVGCGPGLFVEAAQARGFRVTGLELNATLAQRARERTGAEVVVGDFLATPLAGRKFDVITMLDLIEHLPDPVGALAQSAELLAPGGRLVLYTPNHSSVIVRVADLVYRATRGRLAGPVAEIFDCTHVVFFDVATLTRAVHAAGLDCVDVAMGKYDPARSNQATGASALALRGLEAISPLVDGQFRILMFAQKR